MLALKNSLFIAIAFFALFNTKTIKAKPVTLFSKKSNIINSVENLTPAINENTIKIKTLNIPGVDSIGLYDNNFLDNDIWKNSSREFIDNFFKKISISRNSKTTNDIIKKLTLTSFELPSDKSEFESGWLLNQKIKLLFKLGEHDKIIKLIELINQNDNYQILQTKFNSLILNKDYKKACEIPQSIIDKNHNNLYWNKAFNFCLYQNGEKEKALLGVSLMKEDIIKEDNFFEFFNFISEEKSKININIKEITPLDMAFLDIVKVKDFPINISNTTPIWILKSITFNDFAPTDSKIKASEICFNAGVITLKNLQDSYKKYKYNEKIAKTALSWAKNNYDHKARAVLFNEAEKRKSNLEKIEIINKALKLSEKNKLYHLTSNVFAKMIKDLTPSNDNLWFSYNAIKSLIISKNEKQALNWYNFAKKYEKTNKNAAKAICANSPLLNISKGISLISLTPKRFKKIKNHLKEEGFSKKETSNYINKILFIYQAFGTNIRYKDWLYALNANETEKCHSNKSFISNLQEIALDEEKNGEFLAISLLSLFHNFPESICENDLNTIIKGLNKINMEKQAKELAMEYLIK